MLIKVKAKVLLTSEEDMETEGKYDLGDIAKSKEWVWRMVALPVLEVYKVTEFDRTKSIVETYNDEKMLVKESFDELYKRWEDLKIQESTFPEPEIKEETSEDGRESD